MTAPALKDSYEERKSQLEQAIFLSEQRSYMVNGVDRARERQKLQALEQELAQLITENEAPLIVEGCIWDRTEHGYKCGDYSITVFEGIGSVSLHGPDRLFEKHDSAVSAAERAYEAMLYAEGRDQEEADRRAA